MDMFVVDGGTPLVGRARISGSKNAALPVMAAALVADGPVTLTGVPDLADVETLAALLESLGMRIERLGEPRPSGCGSGGTLRLEVVDGRPFVAEYELVRRMRAGFCVLGPLLARRGRAAVSLPGGCNIGDRPIDLHLKGLAALGADIRVERGYVIAEAKRLRGADVYLGGPFGSTVTGTCNVMTAAALAEGVTTIEAAACEPEVVSLGECLNRMGGQISGLGTPFLRIEGVERLHGARHAVIPDRIEAATLMVAAAVTGGRVELENVRLDHLTAVVEKLREIGVEVRGRGAGGRRQEAGGRGQKSVDSCQLSVDTDGLRPLSNWSPTTDNCQLSTVRGQRTTDKSNHQSSILHPSSLIEVSAPGPLCSTDLTALPYPGVPTDVQAQMMALLSVARGISIVTDKVFPDRFMHAAELVRMGARIRREGPTAVIDGVERLSGACVMASDLRASAALVLAALAAEGPSVIRRIYHLDRGYERLEEKLNRLGARIRRVEDDSENVPAPLSAVDDVRAASPPPHFPSSSLPSFAPQGPRRTRRPEPL